MVTVRVLVDFTHYPDNVTETLESAGAEIDVSQEVADLWGARGLVELV